jgi:hypothetical protein
VRERDSPSPGSSDSPEISGVGRRAVKKSASRFLRWLLEGEGVTRNLQGMEVVRMVRMVCQDLSRNLKAPR